ncbi:MAG: TM1266 family iron-only hydrogenase system putative regulator [Lentisphaeria bacterium]
MEKRLGCITLILERQRADVPAVNERISQFSDSVIGRLGLPYPDRGVNIITLIVDCTVERLSALTGQLGRLPGIQVKSLMAKEPRPAGGPGAGRSADAPGQAAE